MDTTGKPRDKRVKPLHHCRMSLTSSRLERLLEAHGEVFPRVTKDSGPPALAELPRSRADAAATGSGQLKRDASQLASNADAGAPNQAPRQSVQLTAAVGEAGKPVPPALQAAAEPEAAAEHMPAPADAHARDHLRGEGQPMHEPTSGIAEQGVTQTAPD